MSNSVTPYKQPSPPTSISSVGAVLAQSGYFADASTAAKAVAKVMAGRELGIGPMSAMSHITINNGKASYDAALLSYLLEQHPRYDYEPVEISESRCEIRFFRDGKLRGTTVWTIEQAKAAGLLESRGGRRSPWLNYPSDFLFARALTQGIRRFCPGLLIGAYVREELDAVGAGNIQGLAHVAAAAQAPPLSPAVPADNVPPPPPLPAPAPSEPLTPLLQQIKEAKQKLENAGHMTSDKWASMLAKKSTPERAVTSARHLTTEEQQLLLNALRKRIHEISIEQLEELASANPPLPPSRIDVSEATAEKPKTLKSDEQILLNRFAVSAAAAP